MAVGRHWAYYVVSITITVVLALAANTSFGGSAGPHQPARPGQLPPAPVLAARRPAGLLQRDLRAERPRRRRCCVAVGGDTNTLIPLFAIGVFTGFTLSQSGLVVHWFGSARPDWHARASVNGLGAVSPATATVIFLVTKFTGGAWVVVVAVPSLHLPVHGGSTATTTGRVSSSASAGCPGKPHGKRTLVIVPVTNVSRPTERALSEALSLGDEVVAVTVVIDHGEAGRAVLAGPLERDWARCGIRGSRSAVLHTEYASIVGPIVAFIDTLGQRL